MEHSFYDNAFLSLYHLYYIQPCSIVLHSSHSTQRHHYKTRDLKLNLQHNIQAITFPTPPPLFTHCCRRLTTRRSIPHLSLPIAAINSRLIDVFARKEIIVNNFPAIGLFSIYLYDKSRLTIRSFAAIQTFIKSFLL